MAPTVPLTNTSIPMFNWKKTDRMKISIQKWGLEMDVRLLSGPTKLRPALGSVISIKDILLTLALAVSGVVESIFKGLRNIGVGIGTLDGKLLLGGIKQLTFGILGVIDIPIYVGIEILRGIFIKIPFILLAPDAYRNTAVESLAKLSRK